MFLYNLQLTLSKWSRAAAVHNYDEALTNLNRTLQIKQITTQDADIYRSVAGTLNNVSCCHTELHNYDEALTNLNRALKLYIKIQL